MTAGLSYLFCIQNFLAVTKPVFGDVLVIESWFPGKRAFADVEKFIREGRYRKILCVAMEEPYLQEQGLPPNAEQAARRLFTMGVKPEIVQVLNVPFVGRDHTYSMAVAARNWLQREMPETQSIDVFTISVHARKSHILFRKAFPPGCKIGIIAGDDRSYPYSRWWLSRRGIYVTLRNTAGYLYAIAFSPPPATKAAH